MHAKEKQDGRSTGLEPATFGITIQRSNQLSYDRHKDISFVSLRDAFSQEEKSGLPAENDGRVIRQKQIHKKETYPLLNTS